MRSFTSSMSAAICRILRVVRIGAHRACAMPDRRLSWAPPKGKTGCIVARAGPSDPFPLSLSSVLREAGAIRPGRRKLRAIDPSVVALLANVTAKTADIDNELWGVDRPGLPSFRRRRRRLIAIASSLSIKRARRSIAPSPMQRGPWKRAVGVDVNLDPRLDEVGPHRAFGDLQFQHPVGHAIVVADLPLLVRAENSVEIDARNRRKLSPRRPDRRRSARCSREGRPRGVRRWPARLWRFRQA